MAQQEQHGEMGAATEQQNGIMDAGDKQKEEEEEEEEEEDEDEEVNEE